MRIICLVAVLALPISGLAAPIPASPTEASCAKLSSFSLPQAKIASTTWIKAGGDVPGASLKSTQMLPAFCRVVVSDHPSSDSDIKTEIWLPGTNWNGKYHGVGNGGFAGEIYYGQMAAAVSQGYATAGTDTGHKGVTPEFALDHPE